jgi:HEAT repeat protein
MGKYAQATAKTGLEHPLNGCTPKDEIDHILELTADDDPLVRRLALKNLCGCHVRADVPRVWDRLYDLIDDPDAGVRFEVVHAFGDSSPNHRAHEIAAAVERLYNDPDPHLRKRVRKLITHYRKTGSVNAL